MAVGPAMPSAASSSMWWSIALRSRPVQPAITRLSRVMVAASARSPCQRIMLSDWVMSAVVAALAAVAQPHADEVAALIGCIVIDEVGAAVADLEIVDVLDLAALDHHLAGQLVA